MSLLMILMVAVFLTWLLLQPVSKVAKLVLIVVVGVGIILLMGEITGVN